MESGRDATSFDFGASGVKRSEPRRSRIGGGGENRAEGGEWGKRRSSAEQGRWDGCDNDNGDTTEGPGF